MADPSKMSIDDILAACRKGTADASTGKKGDDVPSVSATPSESAGSKAPTGVSSTEPTKKAGEMSVAEIMAAARGGSAGAGGTAGSPEPKENPAKEVAPKDPSKMSVADILAAARGGPGSGPAAAPVKQAPAAKPTAAKATEVATPKGAAAAPPDTSSILAAARKGAKPGPMTKEEAAKQAIAAKGAARVVVPAFPDKPAYAKPKTPVVVDGEPRRSFLNVFFGSFLAVGFTSLATVSGLWTLGLARFMFPNILTEPPSRFKVGFPADFAPDTVSTRFTSQYGVWIVNTIYEGARQIVALRTVCTHLGCTPNWLESERKFKCPCHGSGFYIDGINFEGPAPRPLERYAIRISDDGQIEVDKSKKFQQEMGQWSNSASFVTV